MENSNLIATLIPVGDLTKHVFSYPKNKKRCLPPTRGIDEGLASSSREPTPAYERQNDYEDSHRIQLNFDTPPKDPTKGYAFGTDEQKCDVFLGPRSIRGTSGIHFYITFDVIDKDRHIVLRDSSTKGSAVSYNGQAEKEVRHHFTWILNLAKNEEEGGEVGKWEIEVHVRGLRFKVELANHRTCQADYNKNVGKFLDHSQNADPLLDGLSIDSYTTEVAPSQSRTPGQRPIYIHEWKLGKGSYGQVDRVVDVSTGAVYARKKFFKPSWDKDNERKSRQREEWLEKIRREIRIMMQHPHVRTTIQANETDADRR